MKRARCIFAAALAMLSLYAPVALGGDLAGKVSYAVGSSSVERVTPTVAVSQGSFVFEGDTLRTGENAIVQIEMIDGARLLLLPDSILTLQDYRRPSRTADPIAQSAGDGKVTLRLLRGGFRARSGSIGKSLVKANYQVIAPVATLGLVGTEYLLRFCQRNCGSDNQTGLYIAVQQGEIWVQNAGGHVHVKAGAHAVVESGEKKARLESTIPRAIEGVQRFIE